MKKTILLVAAAALLATGAVAKPTHGQCQKQCTVKGGKIDQGCMKSCLHG